ncbi:CBS domain-containing protein [bacterium]|nr:CBS domain-containing protein [bacterium]MBU0899620.1 CBS domain-containing protein [bacterium]MBU1153814.1 CBS domain-containing protein [bacterium]MBU1782678.1 CBS domain-containing protein [bacterium]
MPNLPLKDQEVLKVRDLLKYFYGHGLCSLPVIGKNKRLIGIIKKEDFITASSSLKSLEKPLREFVIKNMISINLPQDLDLLKLASNYKDLKEVPIIDEEGNLVDFWTIQEILLSLDYPVDFSAIKWRKVFDSFPVISIITDLEEKIVLINDLAKKSLFKKLEFHEKKISELFPPLSKISGKDRRFKRKIRERSSLREALVQLNEKKYNCSYALVWDKDQILGKIFLLRELSGGDLDQSASKEILDKEILSLEEIVKRAEKEAISMALKKTEGNISASASLLKVSRGTLQSKIKKLHLTSNDIMTY